MLSESPLTGTLSFTVNDTIDIIIPVEMILEKADPEESSYLAETSIGNKISIIRLTGGWVQSKWR